VLSTSVAYARNAKMCKARRVQFGARFSSRNPLVAARSASPVRHCHTVRSFVLRCFELFRHCESQCTPMARISDIPSEVLAIVFGHLAADRPEDAPDQYARTHSRANFTFSHVCGYWRAVALAEPRLWARVHVLSPAPDCLPTMIARSRDVPLVVGIPLPPYVPYVCGSQGRGSHSIMRAQASFERTLNLLHQVADLDITVRAWMLACTIVYREEAPYAPLLKRLRVDGMDNAYLPPLPQSLLAGGAPLLVHVELSRTSAQWAWSAVRLPCLRTLSVRATKQWSASIYGVDRDTLDALLGALAQSPQLEELALFSSIPPQSSVPVEVVRLPHLRRLTLQSDAVRLAALLAALSFPENTSRAILSNSSPGESVSLEDELAPLAGRFRTVALHVTGELVHWIAHKDGLSSEIAGEWRTRCTGDMIAVPAMFRDTHTLALRLAKRQSLLSALSALSAALPSLTTLRVYGETTCLQCVHAFRKLPADAFPNLREWELADLEPRPYTEALIRKAVEVRQTYGHGLLVLRLPEEVLGPCTAGAVEEQLVGSIEVIPSKECYTPTPRVRREDYRWKASEGPW
jgi:hypothetical protein